MIKQSIIICVGVMVTCQLGHAKANTSDRLINHMQYLAERDMVLSKNIANSDTPKYSPKDVKKNKSSHYSITLRRTHSNHLSVENNIQNEVVQGDVLEIKPNGNKVNIDHELMQKNETASEFQQISNLYGKTRQMLKTAIANNK